MSIVGILLVLVIVGVCLYLVQTYVPMAAPIKTVITVVVVLLLVVWLLEAFGIVDGNFGLRHHAGPLVR
jgi:hypothetical protein